MVNCVGSDQALRSVASDLGLHCLLRRFCPATEGKYGIQYQNGIWAASCEKVPLSMRKMCGFTSSCTCAKTHPGICSPLKLIVANDSVSGQQRPKSDFADAQSDLGLRCLHMPEDTLSKGAAHIKLDLQHLNSRRRH